MKALTDKVLQLNNYRISFQFDSSMILYKAKNTKKNTQTLLIRVCFHLVMKLSLHLQLNCDYNQKFNRLFVFGMDTCQ